MLPDIILTLCGFAVGLCAFILFTNHIANQRALLRRRATGRAIAGWEKRAVGEQVDPYPDEKSE